MLPAFSVVIPCFNEAGRIGATVRATLDYLHENSLQSELIVVNGGKGAAVRSGLLAAQKPIALFFDADLSTPLGETPKLIEPIAHGEIDIAFGSRAINRSLIGQHQPWPREQAGRVFNLLVRLATGLPFWDTQCGFKAFRVDVCRPIFEAARLDGFAFDVELLYLAHRAGLRIREIPVRWNHSAGSKVRFFQDSLRMLLEVIVLRSRAL
jgi:glycosyltransferase involved in cell wall biosynthesis